MSPWLWSAAPRLAKVARTSRSSWSPAISFADSGRYAPPAAFGSARGSYHFCSRPCWFTLTHLAPSSISTSRAVLSRSSTFSESCERSRYAMSSCIVSTSVETARSSARRHWRSSAAGASTRSVSRCQRALDQFRSSSAPPSLRALILPRYAARPSSLTTHCSASSGSYSRTSRAVLRSPHASTASFAFA